MLLGLLDSYVHAVGTYIETQAEVAVNKGCRVGLLDHVNGLVREEDPLVNAVAVDGLKATDAVRVDAPLVGFDQDISADCSLTIRNSVR